jgi:hypothetical protein
MNSFGETIEYPVLKRVENYLREEIKIIIQNHDDSYENIVSKYPWAIEYVPEEMITKELCEITFNNDNTILILIPRNFRTQEMYKLAVLQIPLYLEHIPDELKTSEMCIRAVQDEPHMLKAVPKEYITQEMCNKAVSDDNYVIKYVPKKFLDKLEYSTSSLLL